MSEPIAGRALADINLLKVLQDTLPALYREATTTIDRLEGEVTTWRTKKQWLESVAAGAGVSLDGSP